MAETQTNEEQIRFWNEQGGPRWVRLQQQLDAQISPLGLFAMQRAAVESGEQVLDVRAADAARRRWNWLNESDLKELSSVSIFPRRCLHAHANVRANAASRTSLSCKRMRRRITSSLRVLICSSPDSVSCFSRTQPLRSPISTRPCVPAVGCVSSVGKRWTRMSGRVFPCCGNTACFLTDARFTRCAGTVCVRQSRSGAQPTDNGGVHRSQPRTP